jgi:hypothetical protein
MRKIKNFFLRASDWKMFALLFVSWMVVWALGAAWIPAHLQSRANLGVRGGVLAGVSLLIFWCLLAWLWSIGSFLSSLVEAKQILKPDFFRFAVVYPAVYGVYFTTEFVRLKPLNMAIILPLHLLAMFCIIYCLYFVAKSMVMVETGRDVTFRGYAQQFFLLSLFPVGIWVIQPKINRLFARMSVS